jgi:hypothetical protein
MGASSWHHYTAYRPDPEAALQELRRDVFARGEYSFGMGGLAGHVGTGGPTAGPGAMPGLAGLFQDPARILAATSQLQGPQGRLIRAAMSGDYSELNAEERQMAEQIRPLFQMAAAGRLPEGMEDEGDEEEGEGQGFPPGHRPETIDELLEMVAEDGTHSILDIQRTGTAADFGVATPMSAEQLAEFFGTDRPTREQVEVAWFEAAEELERWQALYTIVYRNGEPHEYAFVGCSGD